MKLLEKDTALAPRGDRIAPSGLVTRPSVRPNIALRTRIVARPTRRRLALGALVNRTMIFAATMGLAYFASTLGGYVLLERARQDARRGEERAAYAQKEAKEAKEAIEALTNPSTLRMWAETHGFVPGEASSEGLVARR